MENIAGRKTPAHLVGLAAAWLACTCLPAPADVVLSEGFESPAISTAPYYHLVSEGDTVGAFITYSESTMRVVNSTLTGSHAYEGDQVLIFGRPGDGLYECEISSALHGLALGATYQISYHYSADTSHFGTYSLYTKMDGNTLDAFSLTMPDQGTGYLFYGTPANPWLLRTTTFVATAESMVFSISGSNYPLGPYTVLDGIVIQQIPEPGAGCLLLAGLALVPLARGQRRQSASARANLFPG